ncbi:tyrosine-type recombinase/integrase [Candidatus Bathyarchaeota archaeon]|nr:tyrosine-type recombinase/integrase [Candidatus Bathyarchaeota archaeon]
MNSPPRCPQCGSKRLYRAGLRYLKDGSTVQRWLCRNCSYRFSEGSQGVRDVNSSLRKPLQKTSRWSLNSCSQIDSNCQVLRAPTGGSKNLATSKTRHEKPMREGTASNKQNMQLMKGKILEFAFWMQKQGYAESTIKGRKIRLETLMKRGANLLDPESFKAILALQKTWSAGTKANAVDAYNLFLEREGIRWDPPRYKRLETIPFIPSEAELNQLIGASSKKLGTFLQGLKETGADPGELAAAKPEDIDQEARIITINKPVKGHRPRTIRVSQDLINRLKMLIQTSGRIFDQEQLRRAFYYKRKTMAHKLANPRLLKITFITFRHWFGTMEYHRTKDILHVQRLLGHKSIQNTLIYIDLETNLFNNANDGFTSRVAHNTGEACSLVEVGFEYVTGEYNDGGKIFRKRN